MAEQTHRYQRYNKVIAYFLFCTGLLVSAHSEASGKAHINGVYGIYRPNYANIYCPTDNSKHFLKDGADLQVDFSQTYQGGCTIAIPSDTYFPTPGHYSIVTYFNNTTGGGVRGAMSASGELTNEGQSDFDTQTSLREMSLTAVTGPDIPLPSDYTNGWLCVTLRNTDTNIEYAIPGYAGSCTGVEPLPPTPPPVQATCKINNSSDLNVALGTVDRALIGTSPGNGTLQNKQIPVTCTGGSVNVNMQLTYTPLTVSGKEVVKSSSNGLGVSIIYNSEVLAPTDTVPVSFLEGSNNLDLAFEIVRDPAVSIGEVPTGEFTASATLIMTQQ